MSLKWLDDILHHPEDGPTEPEEDISMESIIDGVGVISSTDKGTARNKNGDVVAQVEVELSSGTTDFELHYKLRIPKETWERTTIVCDGNAVEVATELAPNGRYIVKRTLRGFKPTKVVEESEIKLREFSTIKEFMNWIENMDTDGVEALRQIYYDRWCFDTASQKDRMYYELLEEEKKGRV
jgi:hypothetical protein